MKQIPNSEFIGKFDQKDKERIMSVLHKPFQRVEGRKNLTILWYHYYPNTKTRKSLQFKKKIPQTTMSNRNRHKTIKYYQIKFKIC